MADQNVLITYSSPTLALNLASLQKSSFYIQVYDPNGNLYHHTEVDSHEKGYYNFQSTKDLTGFYEICFTTSSYQILELHLQIQLDEEQKEYKKIQSKDHLEKLTGLIEQLRDKERLVSTELEYMKEREIAFRFTTDTIDSRLLWGHIFIFILIVGTTIWQIWMMQNYFKIKKLI